ncbi:glycosyltransferase family 9 protein [Telmatospirillum sp.]|uniref:glycosyltransferase family 9 protein n=1 Tax=Telmatospirillum sp. TaxID=2079197 RepID=UPI0028503750|nr:glycosyltransferase family 9 protein [Telmatospirillum sp.]MDR3441148.1 glycosyltransferase family 9 protein [Telmatospirillum sp.]
MAGVAILKPDHLGDLVLSKPAIEAIGRHYSEVTLFVASGSVDLARFLFPDISDVRPADFRHLSRKAIDGISLAGLAEELAGFDFLFCLRDDPVMRQLLALLAIPHVIAEGGHLTHETAIQKRAVAGVVGNYSRTRLFCGVPFSWPGELHHVGLCLAAGFPTNRWPLSSWLSLAAGLTRQGIVVTLIGGPGERQELAYLSRLLGLASHQVVEGGRDFAAFLDALATVDLVVATDGGTGHICSLRKPICSLFGSSPWRRYAPFGHNNVLITRDEVCSPCVQFSSMELNGCLSRECINALPPRAVFRVLGSNGFDFSLAGPVRVERAVSHRYID